MQYIIFQTIFRRELARVFRIWTQTIIPPVLNQSLYFVIFGGIVGASLSISQEYSYAAFLTPGLIAMWVITNSYSNVASSFFGAKFSRSIEEFLISPVQPSTLFLGYVSGGMIRGGIIACITWMVSLFFGAGSLAHPLLAILTISLIAYFFSALGYINALFAKIFDHVSLIPTFFLTPLSYLGGIFYPIHLLPSWAETISYLNPIAWIISLLRYSCIGELPYEPSFLWISLIGLIIACTIVTIASVQMTARGIGMRT